MHKLDEQFVLLHTTSYGYTMLRLLILAITLFIIVSCDANNSMRETASKNPKMNARILAADSGCMGCHSVAITIVGPAWQLVSKRYKNKPEAKKYLIQKIKKGGKGNWNNMTGGKTMPAHEDRLSESEISTLVDYILNL